MKRALASVSVLALLLAGAFAQSPQKLIVMRDSIDYPPLEYHDGGRLTGFHVEQVEAVAARLGLEVEWKEAPWARALYMAEAGEADAVIYLGWTAEREAWALFEEGNALSTTKFSFVIRKESKETIVFNGDAAALLKGRTMMAIRGFALPPAILALNPGIYEAPNMKLMLEMLAARRYDLAFVNHGDFLGAYKDSPLAGQLLCLEPPISGAPTYIAFSKAKGHQDLAARFAAGMEAFKKTLDYQALKLKYGQP